MRRALTRAAGLAVCSLLGQARAQAPSDASVAALIFDLERIVASEESGGGWLLDRQAQDAIHHDVMESVCRATPAVRARAVEQLTRRSALMAAAAPPLVAWLAESGRVASLARAIAVVVVVLQAALVALLLLGPMPEGARASAASSARVAA